MGQLQVTAKLAIKDGKLDAFKEAAAACMESVRARDHGTLQYDWFWNADQTECNVRETYASSEALMEHIGNLGDPFGALLDTSDIVVEVYGDPSTELVEATAAIPVTVYSHYQSI